MEVVFLKLLNLSITAGWLVLAVVLFRLILKKAPKWVFCLLWALVGIRLVLPFSLESVFSLIPSAETVSETIPYTQTPVIDSGVGIVDQAVNPVIAESLVPTAEASVNPVQVITSAASIIWIVGMIVLLLYLIVSYLRLRNCVRTATLLAGNIRQSENVAVPFILGLFKPSIYLPYHLSKNDFKNVIAHENAHLKRRDHLIKPMAFLILTVYWFNPLMWLAYILLCRDIELACDEKVIGTMDEDERKSYSTALLNCNVNRHIMTACPLAFGEVGVKERVIHVKAYKKPAFWIIAVAIIACIVISVCFLTNPIGLEFDFSDNSIIAASSYDMREDSPDPYQRDFTEAQIDELVSRLEGISGARLSEEYDGLTPFYAISAELADGTWIQICGYGPEGDMTDIIYSEKRYMITDTDFAAYVSDICAGKDTEQIVETTDDIGPTSPADGDGRPLILSFEDYSDIYVYEAMEKEYEDSGKNFRDVVSQYNWQIEGTELGSLENDPETAIVLTRADGVRLYIWDDADFLLCTENGGTTISCGKTIINELMPWAKAQYAELLASVPVVSTEDIPSFITVLPTFNWSAYVKANGEQAGAGLIDAFYTYVSDYELNRPQYSLVMQGTIGLDGAYAEGYVDIMDILMDRDPYTLVWCYDRLPAETQAAVLPFIVPISPHHLRRLFLPLWTMYANSFPLRKKSHLRRIPAVRRSLLSIWATA